MLTHLKNTFNQARAALSLKTQETAEGFKSFGKKIVEAPVTKKMVELAQNHLTPNQLFKKVVRALDAKARPWKAPPELQRDLDKATAKAKKVTSLLAKKEQALKEVTEQLTQAEKMQTVQSSVSYKALIKELDDVNDDWKAKKKDSTQKYQAKTAKQRMLALRNGIPPAILKLAPQYRKQILLENQIVNLHKALEKADKVVQHHKRVIASVKASRLTWLASSMANLAVPGTGQVASIALTSITTGTQILSANQLPAEANAKPQAVEAVNLRAACTAASTGTAMACADKVKDIAIGILKAE